MWWRVLVVAWSTRCGCFIKKYENIKTIFVSSSEGLPVACGATQLITNPWFMRSITVMLRIYFYFYFNARLTRSHFIFSTSCWVLLAAGCPFGVSSRSDQKLQPVMSCLTSLGWLLNYVGTSSVHIYPLSGSFFPSGS